MCVRAQFSLQREPRRSNGDERSRVVVAPRLGLTIVLRTTGGSRTTCVVADKARLRRGTNSAARGGRARAGRRRGAPSLAKQGRVGSGRFGLRLAVSGAVRFTVAAAHRIREPPCRWRSQVASAATCASSRSSANPGMSCMRASPGKSCSGRPSRMATIRLCGSGSCTLLLRAQAHRDVGHAFAVAAVAARAQVEVVTRARARRVGRGRRRCGFGARRRVAEQVRRHRVAGRRASAGWSTGPTTLQHLVRGHRVRADAGGQVLAAATPHPSRARPGPAA